MTSHSERHRTLTVLSLMVTVVLMSGYLAFSTSPVALRVRGLLGEGRLDPAVTSDTVGPYAFMATQRGSDSPVGFSPCRPVEYAVNPAGAPDGWREDVRASIGAVARATGLRFEYVGTTDDRDFDDRIGAGGDAEPVLLGWADQEEVSALEGDVAGIGGATMVERGGLRGYVTGSVVLDTASTDRLAYERDGQALHRGLLMHELGHVVGLDPVDDRGELMYAEGVSRPDFGPGDLAGLARLGAVGC